MNCLRMLFCKLGICGRQMKRKYSFKFKYGEYFKYKAVVYNILVLDCLRLNQIFLIKNINFIRLYNYRYGLSPEWVRMCVVTLELCENLRSQIGQRKGFWPVYKEYTTYQIFWHWKNYFKTTYMCAYMCC